MTAIQVALDIPDDILARLLVGEYVRHGGVVRDLSGQLVKLLDDGLPIDQAQEVARASATKALTNPRLIVIGLGVVGVAMGGVVLWANRKSTKTEQPRELTCVEEYNTSVAAYLEATRRGNLNADHIDRLISGLDAVMAKSADGSIEIQFSPEQQETLVKIVVDHARKTAEAHRVEFGGFQDRLADGGGGSAVVDLRRCLEIQSRIIKDAA